MCMLIPIPQCFNYYNFIISLDTWEYDYCHFVLILQQLFESQYINFHNSFHWDYLHSSWIFESIRLIFFNFQSSNPWILLRWYLTIFNFSLHCFLAYYVRGLIQIFLYIFFLNNLCFAARVNVILNFHFKNYCIFTI